MEKYFEGEPFTEVEALTGLLEGVTNGDIYPVYACAADKLEGIDQLLNGLVNLGPSASSKTGETATDKDGNEVELPCDPNGPLAAICFKTIADPFVGKMSFIKVISGTIKADTPCYCARTGESERMGKISIPHGGTLEDSTEITAGDIAVVTKLTGIKTGDTITAANNPLTLKGLTVPTPCYSLAVSAKKKGEEDKIASGLARLMEEDPTISFGTNKETKEQVLSGQGEQHIDFIVGKLKSKFGVDVELANSASTSNSPLRKSLTVKPSARPSRSRANIRNSPAATASTVTSGSASSPPPSPASSSPKRSSAVPSRRTSSRPLKRAFRTPSRRAFSPVIRWSV